MDEIEVQELPFLRAIFVAMYKRNSPGVAAAIEDMKAQRPVSDRSWRRLVEIAAELNDADIARALIACGLPLGSTYPAICIAARNNHCAVLRELVDAGAPVNGAEPSHTA